jgi:site-specific recombinase XerD
MSDQGRKYSLELQICAAALSPYATVSSLKITLKPSLIRHFFVSQFIDNGII